MKTLCARFRPARATRAVLPAFAVSILLAAPAAASDQMYFPAVDNVTNVIVQHINAETVRLDISAWYLTEHAISIAIANRFAAGVPVRLLGDRGSIFEIDPLTRKEFYWLANQGVPIRLRFNPTWYPEIDHWKAAIFVGQNVVEFGSANWTPFQLAPTSSTNYDDETALFTDDPVLVGAFKTKFDQMWNDTTKEPESIISGPPYFKNWDDACANEPLGCDFRTQYPNPAPMVIDTARLEPDNPMPADLIWGQGPDFNNRLITEINKETSLIQFVIYRITVSNIANALLAKFQAGVPVQLIIEPNEYLNRKWPEFWLTHANVDKLWAAGVPIKQRVHQGITHMKTLVTSAYATNASSNYSAAWERDQDYFVSATGKPAIYTALKDRVTAMWNDTAGFAPFQPQRPDAPTLASPAAGAGGVATTTALVWNIAPFATNYDVFLGTSSSSMAKVGNVAAQLTNNPPSTYSFTPSSLCAGTTYFWQVVSRTNATPVNPSMVASSPVGSFTTAGVSDGCSGGGGGGGGGSVPPPWATADVGSVGLPGSATFSNGTFTVSGAGSDIWGTADSFRYVYQPISGDTTLVARVSAEQNTGSFAKAGIMLRGSLSASAQHVVLDRRPDGSVEFMTRSSSGGQTTYVAGTTASLPAWLRLTLSGTTVTGAISANGSTWTTVGTASLSGAADAGLVVTSHNTSALNTSTFDNVSVTTGSGGGGGGGGTLPSPWTNQDVGSVGIAGSASASSGTFTVKGAGADIWGTADSFQYVSQPLSGDGQIVARAVSVQNTSSFAKGGVMLRETTAAGSAHVILDVRPDGSVEFMKRASTNGSTTFLASASQPFPTWLKLARSGNTVTGSVSANGSTWTTVGTTTVSMSTSATIGLAVTSHNTSALNTSTFDNVTVSTGGGSPPPPPAGDVVIYAGDIPASALRGAWATAQDSTSPNGIKLITPDNGVANTNNPLASPADFVDVTFNAEANTPYRIWLRLQANGNSKSNDSLWVQFSDARVNGAAVYPINTTSGLLVNLATDSTGSSLSGWGWQNTAYWLSQATTITFPTTGTHTLRIQVREDGVQFDQIVLSPATFLSSAPGPVRNDSTIVPKP